MNSPSRRSIFISYAHADKEWMVKFTKHLKSLEQEGVLSLWADPQIQPGDDWLAAIRGAIDNSCLAVLMISPDFLVSQFINETELHLLREAERRGLTILWFSLRWATIPGWLGGIQSLNAPESPVESALSADKEFVKICKQIRDVYTKLQVQPPPPPPRDKAFAQPVRSFPVRHQDAGLCLMDAAGQLWVMEGQQLKVFHVRQDEACGREQLPKGQWKHHAAQTWRGHVLLSDWNGAIYRFDGQHHTREKPFHEPKHDDLPVHRLAVGPADHLFAAAWNGLIRRWDADGQAGAQGWPITIPALPLHLAPLDDGGLAVADQAGDVHCFSAAGTREWQWHGQGIRQMWSAQVEGEPAAIAIQLGPRRLLSLSGGRVAESLELPSPVRAAAWRRQSHGGQLGAVACESGRIEWLSLPGFTRLDSVEVDFPVRQIEIIRNLQDEARLTAVGLSADGCLFTLDEGILTRFDQPRGILTLLADPTGRFLHLVFERKIEIYANPVARSIACRAEVVGPVSGKLKLNSFRKLVVKLKNTGLLPIQQVQAEVVATDDVQTHRSPHTLSAPWTPGAAIDLEFSVRAKAEGDLPLQLQISLFDEAGSPTMFETTVHVSSET